MAELNIELWIGDVAEIRSKRVRKQKTDRQDARLILRIDRIKPECLEAHWPEANVLIPAGRCDPSSMPDYNAIVEIVKLQCLSKLVSETEVQSAD